MTKKKGPTPKKRRIRLMVIPEPEPNTRSVLIYTGDGTVMIQGAGNITMECGQCGVPLIQGVNVSQVQSMVLKCPNCGAFNETLA